MLRREPCLLPYVERPITTPDYQTLTQTASAVLGADSWIADGSGLEIGTHVLGKQDQTNVPIRVVLLP